MKRVKTCLAQFMQKAFNSQRYNNDNTAHAANHPRRRVLYRCSASCHFLGVQLSGSLSLSLYLDSNFLELSISPTSLKIIIIRIRITELKGLHVLVIILFNLRDFWPFKVIPCLKPEVQHSKNKKNKKEFGNLQVLSYLQILKTIIYAL